jgi:hypothetical protein
VNLLDRIRTTLGEPLLREIGAKDLRAYESGTGVYFDIRKAPCGASHIVILWNDDTDRCRVQLYRCRSNLTRAQGKSGVIWAELPAVVRRLSCHGG